MYSDNHFDDLTFEPGSANPGYSSTFDINDFGLSTELFSDPGYHISSASSSSNPLLQTIQRNTASSSSSSRFSSNINNNNAYHHDYSNSHVGTGGVGGSITGGIMNENDNPSSSSMSGIGNALLGSPQPSTIKKLKSHLSGIGGIGGYLTSPMGAFRQHNNNDSTNASPAYSVLKPKTTSSGSNLNHHHQHSLGSSPLKPIHSSNQQKQDLQCLELHTTTTPALPPMPQPLQAGDTTTSSNDYSAPHMQRLQSAPASVPSASTTTTTTATSGKSSRSSKRNNNTSASDALNVPPLPQPQSATSATFNEMDYGGMRIYGRPIKRSNSEDPSSTNSYNDNSTSNYGDNGNRLKANASFLPYPDQLPTVTLGRGIKNARDVLPSGDSSSSSTSFPMAKSESEPIPPSNKPKGLTNLNKPFIQYVPPNSPAAKSANARNKKSLTVKTMTENNNDSQGKNNINNNKGKMVPIRMTRQAHEISPLTPPISATMIPSSASMTSPHQHQASQMQSYQGHSLQQQQQYPSQQHQLSPYQQQQQDTYLSPGSNTFDFTTTSQSQFGIIGGEAGGGGQSNLPSIMPSFEFSLEQFGVGDGQSLSNGTSQDLIDQFSTNCSSNNGYNSNNAIDFSSVLGLPSPHQLHSQSTNQSGSGITVNHGLLSPTATQPPHSAGSTHSSVFSDDQALLFGIPPPASPYFTSTSPSTTVMVPPDEAQSQSIDQALASLLGTAHQQHQQISNRDGSSTPQPQLNLQSFSPSHQQQQQIFSPNMQNNQQHQHQGQIALGVSSPPLSPQHNTMTSPAPSASWAPYQQQSNMQNLLPNIDPSLQGLDNTQHQQQQNFAMLSPQSAHYGGINNNNDNHYTSMQNNNYVQGNNGRILSSPRRLRGMQSAPDLNAMYSDASNGFNEAFGIISPSPRKPSLKRGRGASTYADGEDSDEENQQTPSQHQYNGYTQYGDGSSEQDDDEDEYNPGDGYDRPPPRKRANSIHSGGKIDPSLHGGNNAVAAVLLPLVNPNPARLRPGPKPKTSLPNLQAAHQGVFQVSPRAPPVPAFPAQFLTAVTSPNPSHHTAESSSGQTPGSTTITTAGGCLSPDPDTGYLKPQGGVSKDMLATFYQVGTGSKQTKKGKPQRMYICSIPGCEKEFPRKSAVESHIQTHLEDKPFACPYDSWSHDLTRHVRIHSGSKPFQCICGKGFARGDALTRHRQRGICEGSLVPRRW